MRWLAILFLSTHVLVARGQNALGLRAGPVFFSGGNTMTNTSAFATGVVFQQMTPHGNGFRLALDMIRRGFHTHHYNAGTSLQESLDVRVVTAQLGTEIRFALGPGRGLYFEMGPVLGFNLLQERTGEGVYGINPNHPPVIYDRVQDRSFEICEVRLRLGLGHDLVLSERFMLTMSGSLAPGWSSWLPTHPSMLLDVQLMAGLVHVLGDRHNKPVEVNDPIGYRVPGNSQPAGKMGPLAWDPPR